MNQQNPFSAAIATKLVNRMGVTAETATKAQIYTACSAVLRDQLGQKLALTRQLEHGKRKLYYLSVEFLQGRALGNNLLNLDCAESFKEALAGFGVTLEELESFEPEPGLGNGGLGRLASCFLDALATERYPAMGCGIRFEYGLFRQHIRNGHQTEGPDTWLDDCGGVYPWEFIVPDDTQEVRFYGHVSEKWHGGRLFVEHTDYSTVRAVPYDLPISGYKTDTCSLLRLWSAVAPKRIDMESFAQGDYAKAMRERGEVEAISKVLYPCEDHMAGKELRLKQHYFFTSATMQYIIRDFKRQHGNDLRLLKEKIAVQINDTHPALAIPELMRILMDDEGLDWDTSWDIVHNVFNYTNHTVMQEALERWPEDLYRVLLPRIYTITRTIDDKYRAYLRTFYKSREDKVSSMAIIGDGSVRMANLCIATSKKVNGVSALHGDILKEDLFHDWFLIEPDKFIHVTNGITPRRWIMKANPALSSLIDEAIGDAWRADLSRLNDLVPLAADKAFQERFAGVKRTNKERLVNYLMAKQQVAIDPASVFDVQVKRMHEYKRQSLNILHILYLYDRLLNDPAFTMQPTTFFFGGKASANYVVAKETIFLINAVAAMLDHAPARVRECLKVVFIENYNVSAAEMLIPSAEISEQLSTAGKEASGTGNMKFMLNGAITIGTMDGANVEMSQAVGLDNIYIFGLSAQQIDDAGHTPFEGVVDVSSLSEDILSALDYVTNFAGGNSLLSPTGELEQFAASLTISRWGSRPDPYYVTADFDSYKDVHGTLLGLYRDKSAWNQKAIMNTACSGIFSSDRAIEDYNRLVWHLPRLDA